MILVIQTAKGVTLTPAAGWTLVAAQANDPGDDTDLTADTNYDDTRPNYLANIDLIKVSVYRKLAASNEPASYAWSSDAPTQWAYNYRVYTGNTTDAATLVNANVKACTGWSKDYESGTSSILGSTATAYDYYAAKTTQYVPKITTDLANAHVVGVCGTGIDTTYTFDGITKIEDQSADSMSMGIAEGVQTTAGSRAGMRVRTADAAYCAVVFIALKAA